jgi:hypothetical protein
MKKILYTTLLAGSLFGQQPLQVGSQKQLFIDYKFIESAEGIQLMMQEPFQTREKLVFADQAWEKEASLGSYNTVVQEGDKVRLWYDIRSGAPPPGQKNPAFMGMAYAESRDGIHFSKPVQNLITYHGSSKNNWVLPPNPDQLAIGGGSVWRDENPACPPEQRYKSWTKIYPRNNSSIKGPHRIFTSPDGIHWSLDEREFKGLRAADTQPSWFWEPRIGRYIGYSREWVRATSGFGFRAASYNESDDLFNWDNMVMVLEPDERDHSATPAMHVDVSQIKVQGENIMPQYQTTSAAGTGGEDQVLTPVAPMDFYGPGVFPYEGVYIALTPVFYHWKGSANEAWPNTSDIQLAISRDGLHFTRPGNRQPFLRPGPEGSWDSKWIYPVLRPIRMGDELWIYYFGTNRDHAHRLDARATVMETAISRAILRLDGFMAAVADYTGGTLLTPLLSFKGNRLVLNLDTGAGGYALIEILDEAGKPIPGFTFHNADELNGNSVNKTVTWNGNADLSSLAGQPIRLHIRMRSAKLYAFQFLP